MKYFRLKLIVLFLFVLTGLIALASVFGQSEYFFTQLVLGSIILFLLWQCFYLIDTTNREVGKFLFALNYLDSSLTFPNNTKNSFQKLYQGLNEATEQIALKSEKSGQQSQWMEAVIRRMPFGVLLVDEKGEIIFQNDFLQDFLAVPSLKNLEQFSQYQKSLCLAIQQTPLEERQMSVLENGREVEIYKVGFKQEQPFEIIFIQVIEELKGSIEMDAWMRLIRVLTHEIMNSITSISSLASTMHESIKADGLSSDLQLAAESIEKRSQSLIAFTDSYRKVSDSKAAQKTWFLLSDVIQEQVHFLSKELDGVSITIQPESEQQILADQQQVEQVFINLLLNAKTAVQQTSSPSIQINIWQEKTNCKVHFEDNGVGISNKNQNHIFVPFFTTKENGKGIGLSLCRQLMHQNNGAISLQESKARKTVFQLQFRN